MKIPKYRSRILVECAPTSFSRRERRSFHDGSGFLFHDGSVVILLFKQACNRSQQSITILRTGMRVIQIRSRLGYLEPIGCVSTWRGPALSHANSAIHPWVIFLV